MNKDVLVVDDNAANTFALAAMLRQMGFEVDEAASGVEAINLSCHKNYRLILMDYLMPEMDGIQTIQQIQFIMKGQECPAFAGLSATLDESVMVAFEQVGVGFLLQKPVRMEDLEEILCRIGISVEESQEENQPEQINLEEIFSGTAGLDYEKGIDLLAGSVDNYMKVLKVCVKNITDNYMSLYSLKDTGQLDRFALHFHSLKGVFLNIGADNLAKWSKELELTAKEGRQEDVFMCLEKYMAQIREFADKIQEAYEKYTSYQKESFGAAEVSGSEFARQLSELKQHIGDFEYIEITELLNQMLAGCQDERREGLEKISDAIQEFNYDLALEVLEQFKSTL